MTKPITRSLLLPLLSVAALGNGMLRIHNVDDFINFSNSVNSGTNYFGTTVFLDSDIEDSGKTTHEPIGKDPSNYFNGTFDGQGYVVSNLAISSTSQYVGLFGYSKGMTVKNVVLGHSCSVTSSLKDSKNVQVGGIVGYCQATDSPCDIENCVSVANIIFDGDLITGGYDLYLGGIAGFLQNYLNNGFESTAKNCVNYGTVTHSGKAEISYIGGLIGTLEGSSEKKVHIENCLNYGKIVHDGETTNSLQIGGIVGYGYISEIKNCVSAGAISSNNETGTIGSVVGHIYSSSLSHCYWNDTIKFSACVESSSSGISDIAKFNNNDFELNGTISIGGYNGTSLIEALNAYSDYYSSAEYSRWALNKGEASVSFMINNRTNSLVLNSSIILLPSLANEGNLSFDGWYEDVECLSSFTEDDVTVGTTLYGKFEENKNNYTINFNARGGSSVQSVTAQFNSIVSLPSNVIKGNCTFGYWENEYGERTGWSFTVPAHNLTLYAVWLCTRLASPDDLIAFSKIVNSGTSFDGATVFLDSDIDFGNESSRQFEQIGKDENNYFRGTFNGQGHLISNLVINSTSQYVGLFGYSKGMTVKNVVMDSSCSVISSYKSGSGSGSNFTYLGSIIGYCRAEHGLCSVANSVSAASVFFNGASDYLYFGGLVGSLQSTNNSFVKNCANYGTITHSGNTGRSVIGGIIGYSNVDSTSLKISIHNCLNYGKIVHDGETTDSLQIGGIVGYGYINEIKNCVSAGAISSNNEAGTIGSVVGHIYSSSLSHCYWDETIKRSACVESYSSNISGIAKFNNNDFELNGTISIGNYNGTSLIEALNAYSGYYSSAEYSRWALNKGEASVSFMINNRANSLMLNSRIILLPNLANEGKIFFDGWCTDESCRIPFTKTKIDASINLYANYGENDNNYTVSFDTRGGTPIEAILRQYLSVVSLPRKVIKGNCTFGYWENEYGERTGWDFTVPAHNLTLYAVWLCTRLASPDDLIAFSKIVNSGTSFEGTTVFLDSDIDFGGEAFEPIGYYSSNDNKYHFNGTFDGQGHRISNLVMKSTLQYTGLFGYSKGMTVKNVVIDESCIITVSYTGSSSYVGGIVGQCLSDYVPCNVENSVNMANVDFNGVSSNMLYIGGIAGVLGSSSKRSPIVKNCANYGSIAHPGESDRSYLGGVVGSFYGSQGSDAYIKNCLNYGIITYTGTGASTDELFVGGIVGSGSHFVLENCLNSGKISSIPSDNIGAIAGYANCASITHSFWTSDPGHNAVTGTGNATVGLETSIVELNLTTVSKLNSNLSVNSWNKWLLNSNNSSVTFKLDEFSNFIINYRIFLLPHPTDSDGRLFSGWYKDEDMFYLLDSNEVTTDTTMYGMFCEPSYPVAMDANGGSELDVKEIVVSFNEVYGALPISNKTGYSFIGWFNRMNESVTSETIVSIPKSHTLTAQWEINKYTVTFDFGNKTTISESFYFNDTIEYPRNLINEGYTFGGWDNKHDRVPAHNITVIARWKENTENPSEFVEVVMQSNNLNEEEIKEIIKKLTGEEFVITKIEKDESGNIKVIIKFDDVKKASSFIENIKESSDTEKSVIANVGFAGDMGSFSSLVCPFLFLYTIF